MAVARLSTGSVRNMVVVAGAGIDFRLGQGHLDFPACHSYRKVLGKETNCGAGIGFWLGKVT